MSKTEKTEISDLRRYMEQSLAEHYTQVITFKDREDSFVSLYAHKDTGKKMLLRRSGNRNDGVYRALRGKRLCNLPMVLEVCSEEAHLLVLEEYIEGRTLDKILDSGQLTSAQAAAYTIDLCHALEELHSLGIVHRDIKPANVMITPENRAVLLDLSIAREISSDQQDTRSLGTVGYAAPEQYGVAQSNRATDLYALGVLLNTMITRRAPGSGYSPRTHSPHCAKGHGYANLQTVQICRCYGSRPASLRTDYKNQEDARLSRRALLYFCLKIVTPGTISA